MTPGPRKRGLELSGGVRSPPQVPRRNADRRARCASARAGPEARASGNIRSRGSDSTPCVCRRSASLAFLFSCSEWKRRRRIGAHLPPPRQRGRGTTGARVASEPWWRGRVTRRFVVVEERARMPEQVCDACVAWRPAPPPPPCFRLRALRFGGLKPAVARRASEGGSQGGPPPPLSRWRMGVRLSRLNKTEIDHAIVTQKASRSTALPQAAHVRRGARGGRCRACRDLPAVLRRARSLARLRETAVPAAPLLSRRADRLFRAWPAPCVGKAAA